MSQKNYKSPERTAALLKLQVIASEARRAIGTAGLRASMTYELTESDLLVVHTLPPHRRHRLGGGIAHRTLFHHVTSNQAPMLTSLAVDEQYLSTYSRQTPFAATPEQCKNPVALGMATVLLHDIKHPRNAGEAWRSATTAEVVTFATNFGMQEQQPAAAIDEPALVSRHQFS